MEEPLMRFIGNAAQAAVRGDIGRGASPAALALITTTFPAGRERNRAFAVYAAMAGVGAAVGLILGGWLTGLDDPLGIAGWRYTFLIVVPIGLLAALLAPRVLPESDRHDGVLDVPGAPQIAAAPAPLRLIDAQMLANTIGSSRAGDPELDRAGLANLLRRASHLVVDLGDRITKLELPRVVVGGRGSRSVVVDAWCEQTPSGDNPTTGLAPPRIG